MRTTRYESEDSSGMLCALICMSRMHYFLRNRVLSHQNPPNLLDLPVQALVAGMVCKWQMEPACRCHYGLSDQAQGNKYIMTPKRYNAYHHKHLQKAPFIIMGESTLTILSNLLQEIYACILFILCTYTTSIMVTAPSYIQPCLSPRMIHIIQVTAAVVTCGGLCPGLNDVIQNIVFTLEDYGVPPDQIFGIKYGLRGFYDRDFKPINLNKRIVQNIHLQGGTMLVSNLSTSASAEFTNSETLSVYFGNDSITNSLGGMFQVDWSERGDF